MPLITFPTLAELTAAEGTTVGPSPWRTITQEQINLFAEATGDHQWIHVDVERAAAGPYGKTIAHGLLTLSLAPMFVRELFVVENLSSAINYGYDKVRFVNPVPVDSRLRASGTITKVSEIKGGVQLHVTTTIELEGADKPACIVESIGRYFA